MTPPDPKPVRKSVPVPRNEPSDTDDDEPIDLEWPIEEGDANAQPV